MTRGRRARAGLQLAAAVGAVAVLDAQGGRRTASDEAAAFLLGTAIDAVAREPVADAVVELMRGDGASLPVKRLTDGRGRFFFGDLEDGRYRVRVSAPGYLTVDAPASPESAPLEWLDLARDRTVGSLDVPLWRAPSIRGRVTDVDGDPLIGLAVRAIRISSPLDSMRAMRAEYVAQTDDRGEYAFDVSPGEYIVGISAMPPGGSTSASVVGTSLPGGTRPAGLASMIAGALVGQTGTTQRPVGVAPLMPTSTGEQWTRSQVFFNSTGASGPEPLRLGPGEDLIGIDMTVPLARAVRIGGTVIGLETGSAYVRLVPDWDFTDWGGVPDVGLETARTTTGGNGSFVFEAVPSGRYTLIASHVRRDDAGRSPGQRDLRLVLTGRAAIDVGAEGIDGISVVLGMGPSIRGRVTIDPSSSAPPPPVDGVRITAQPLAPFRLGVDRVNADTSTSRTGEFHSGSLLPGTYVIDAVLPAGWYVGSMRVDGGAAGTVRPVDIDADVDMELMLTDAFGSVSGTISPVSTPEAPASVLVFPEDRELWRDVRHDTSRFRQVAVANSGEFVIAALPPGAYYAAAVHTGPWAGWWRAPQSLDALSRVADGFRLRGRESAVVHLTVRTP